MVIKETWDTYRYIFLNLKFFANLDLESLALQVLFLIHLGRFLNSFSFSSPLSFLSKQPFFAPILCSLSVSVPEKKLKGFSSAWNKLWQPWRKEGGRQGGHKQRQTLRQVPINTNTNTNTPLPPTTPKKTITKIPKIYSSTTIPNNPKPELRFVATVTTGGRVKFVPAV